MKKIKINEGIFFVIVMVLSLGSWGALASYTDMPILTFFLVYISTGIFIVLCRRYVIEIKHNNDASSG
jgi:hypothetical protein